MPRMIATFDVPDGYSTEDIALLLDCELPLIGPGADSADSTVYATEDDYLADLAEMVCRTGPCWRCGTEVTEQFDVIALDGAGMNTCPESDEFDMPHEIDEPE